MREWESSLHGVIIVACEKCKNGYCPKNIVVNVFPGICCNISYCVHTRSSLEYEVQLRQYKKTVGVVFNTAKKLGSNPPSENYLVALNNLSTQPSQLRTVFDCTTSVGTALDLLDQSRVRLQALQALEDKLNVNMEAQVNDQTLFDIGAVSVCNGLALASLLSPQLDFNPFNVTRTEHKILNDLVSTMAYVM